MRRMRLFGSAICGSFALLGGLVLAAPGPAPIPVETMIANVNTAISPHLQLQDDQTGGAYFNGVGGVTSIITTAPGYTHTAGDYYMDTLGHGKNTRRFYLSFDQPDLASSTPGTKNVFPAGMYTGFIRANCDLQSHDLRAIPALTNGAATVIMCPFNVGFVVDGTNYALVQNPGPTTDNGIVQFPGTSYGQFTCTSGGTGLCTQFNVTPQGYPASGPTNGPYYNVARLVQGTGEQPLATLGDFYFSFQVTIIN